MPQLTLVERSGAGKATPDEDDALEASAAMYHRQQQTEKFLSVCG